MGQVGFCGPSAYNSPELDAPIPAVLCHGPRFAGPIHCPGRGRPPNVLGPMVRSAPKPMLVPSHTEETLLIGPSLLHRNVAIRPPYPLQRRDGDGCILAVANPQPHRPVENSRTAEQNARADIDALLSAGAGLSGGLADLSRLLRRSVASWSFRHGSPRSASSEQSTANIGFESRPCRIWLTADKLRSDIAAAPSILNLIGGLSLP